MSATQTPPRAVDPVERNSFASTLRAEWTKFRTVRGWVIGMIVAAILTVLVGLFAAGGVNIGCASPGDPAKSGKACLPYIPHGPGGEVVTDSFNFAHQPLTGNGSITVRVTSFRGEHANVNGHPAQAGNGPNMAPGLMPWSKAGIIIKQNLHQGSAYAAIMVTGRNGVRVNQLVQRSDCLSQVLVQLEHNAGTRHCLLHWALVRDHTEHWLCTESELKRTIVGSLHQVLHCRGASKGVSHFQLLTELRTYPMRPASLANMAIRSCWFLASPSEA